MRGLLSAAVLAATAGTVTATSGPTPSPSASPTPSPSSSSSASSYMSFYLFYLAEVFGSGLETSTPWGPVSTDASGHCDANDCLGGSCYDWALIEGVDRFQKSITFPALDRLEDPLDIFVALQNTNTSDPEYVAALAELTDAVDGQRFDFYQTLEDFACCDCDGCMKLSMCYQPLEGVPGSVSCADIWEFLEPTVHTDAQLIDALDTLNAGGCYWCTELYEAADGLYPNVFLQNFGFSSFPKPDTTTTTTTSTYLTSTSVSTTTTTTTTSAADSTSSTESCAVLGCGNAGSQCSCDINCLVDYASTGLPCCSDYSDSCPEICPEQSYEVDRDGSEEYNYVDIYGVYYYYYYSYYYYYYYYGYYYYDYDENGDGFIPRYGHYNCDDIIGLYKLSDDTEQFTCQNLENLYGLDCGGCFCAEPPPAPAPAPIAACSAENANCGFGWVEPMSCDMLIEASRETLFTFPDQLQSHLTCASLESLGCDCEGCGCERTPECAGVYDYGDSNIEVLCMGGSSCDYWVQRLPDMTCEILEDEYGCNCNYCECDATVPDSTTAPACECEVSYDWDLDLGGADITCDTLSAFLEPEGLCCGVMEYAFQMDCSGCCCEVERCDSCLENTTSVPTTTIPTTTTEACPANENFYDECSFDYTCRNNEVVPQTNLYQKTYDCFWIANYLESPENCFAFFGSPSCDPNNDTCADEVVGGACRQKNNGNYVCHACTDNIPGAEVETPTDAPCYYANHVDPFTGDPNPLYTAFDCVDDHLNGPGCVYFNNTYKESVDSFCQIKLDDVDCPDAPEDCNDVCTPQWIPRTGCSASCGSGQRQMEYTCYNTQDGIDCGMDNDPPTNCVAQGITQVGDISFSTCNTQSCGSAADGCDPLLEGDGYCDWTDQADYAAYFDDNDLLAVNNNIEACDWDGGDCCAYSCVNDVASESTANWWGDTRGETCAWGGGGCQRVTEAQALAAISATSVWFNPGGGLGSSPGITCNEIESNVFDCCQQVVLFTSASVSTGACSYGSQTYSDCATQSGRCLDPNAPGTSSTSTSVAP